VGGRGREAVDTAVNTSGKHVIKERKVENVKKYIWHLLNPSSRLISLTHQVHPQSPLFS